MITRVRGLIWFKRDQRKIWNWLKLSQFLDCSHSKGKKCSLNSSPTDFFLSLQFLWFVFIGRRVTQKVIEFYTFLHVIFNRNEMESWYHFSKKKKCYFYAHANSEEKEEICKMLCICEYKIEDSCCARERIAEPPWHIFNIYDFRRFADHRSLWIDITKPRVSERGRAVIASWYRALCCRVLYESKHTNKLCVVLCV